MQHRAVEGMDAPHHDAQEDISFGMRLVAQQAAGEKGNDRERDAERCGDREENGDGERSRELARAFRQEEKRQEGEDQRRGAADDRERYLRCRGDGGFVAALSLAQISLDILHHDD